MGEPGDRFRRLRRQDGRGREEPAQRTGNLFEHFGISLDPAPLETEPPLPIDAAPCRTCAWFVPYRRTESACPICADPDPLAPAASTDPR